ALPTGITSMTERNLAWMTPQGRVIVGFSRIKVGTLRFGMVARNLPMGDYPLACSFYSRLCHGFTRFDREDFLRERETAESSDNNAETFRTTLGAVVQAYGIPNGGTLVVVAIPADRLVPDALARQAT